MAQEQLNSLQDVFEAELNDVMSAEKQIIEAMPKMIDHAHSPRLKMKFEQHLKQTRDQVDRLQTVFSKLGIEQKDEVCDGMKGILKDGSKILEAEGNPAAIDAAMIAAAQRVEHYEISAYGTLRALAQTLGYSDAAELLQMTLKEESQTDKLLTDLAMESINRKAA